MSDCAEVTLFVCANCARPGKELTSACRGKPAIPDFRLPCRVQQIMVPCAGRLQPEHVLRAFETGSSIVAVAACEEDNCHHAEGSRRCSLRVNYIRAILDEIGLGEGRLLLFHLPGSASEDMALASGREPVPLLPDVLSSAVSELQAGTIEALQSHPSNPLNRVSADLDSDSRGGY